MKGIYTIELPHIINSHVIGDYYNIIPDVEKLTLEHKSTNQMLIIHAKDNQIFNYYNEASFIRIEIPNSRTLIELHVEKIVMLQQDNDNDFSIELLMKPKPIL